MNPILLNILLTVAGALLGWFLSIILKNYSKPDILISALDDNLNTNPGTHKFLALNVENKKRSWLKKAIFGEKAALFCKAKVEYFNENGSNLFSSSFDGRWSSTGEPVMQVGNERHFQYNRVPDLRFEHIMPGDSSNLAIAIKINGDQEFFAFDNVSYAYLSDAFRDPNKKVSDRLCKIKVQVTSVDGIYPKKYFWIHNPSSRLNGFKISPNRGN